MNHTIMPVTAQGEPIQLIKLGQGREEMPVPFADKLYGEEPQTFASKLHAAGRNAAECKEPVLPGPLPQGGGLAQWREEESPVELPLVSQRGFKAGVFATCIGGAFLAALYLGSGALICGCVASGCVGFVAGMLMTEDWK